MSHYRKFYKAVLAGGFSIVPLLPNDKRPAISAWQEFCKRQPTDIEADSWLTYEGGLGLPCGEFCIAVDIDLLDPPTAAEAERRVLEIAGCQETLVRTGMFPKRVLLFRPDGAIKSTSSRWEDPAHKEKQGFEILSHGRQVVSFGVHPDTGRDYVWRGGSPATVTASALPTLTPAMVEAIIAALNAFRPIDQPKLTTIAKNIDRKSPTNGASPINSEAVAFIMDRLPNTEATTWEEWVRVGFALHKTLGGEGWNAFNYWSSKSSRYTERETAHKWQTICRDDRGDVGFGTLLAMANAHGIKLPHEIRFSSDEPSAPEIDLADYVQRLASVEVSEDGLSSADYWIYLNHIYSGRDDVAALYAERCANEPVPDNVTSDDIERVRLVVIRQLGGVGGESARRVKVAYQSEVTLQHMRDFFLNAIKQEEVPESDNPVTRHGMTLRLTPRDIPTPPAAARFRVPGLICEFADWVNETSPSNVPEFGVTTALALVSVLCGRSVKTLTGIRPNIYIVNLASSGAGKNNGPKRLRKALSSVDALSRHTFGSNATSGAAIRNRFERAAGTKDEPDLADGSSMSKIWLSDEMGGVWAVAAQNAALGTSIMTDLLTFFSASDEIMEGTAMANKSAPMLPYPHLSILGTSTPSSMFEHMSLAQLKHGHANRFLMMEPRAIQPRSLNEKLSKWRGGGGHSNVPIGVLNTMSALIRWTEAQRGLISSTWDDYAHVVDMDNDATELIARIEELKETALIAAESSGLIGEPFSRIDEITCKLALLSAMSRLTETLTKDSGGFAVIGRPIIMAADVRFGFELARYSAERIAHIASNIVSDASAVHVEPVLRAIRSSGADGIQRSALMRRVRMSKRSIDSAIETLTDSRQIIGVKTKSKTKAGLTYYLTGFAKAAVVSGGIDPNVETTWNFH